MNITPQSMQDIILRNMKEVDVDPHLKKLLEELNTLKAELYGNKEEKNVLTVSANDSENNTSNFQKKKRKPRSYIKFGEKRMSERLSGKLPQYNFKDDIDEWENKTVFSNVHLNFSKSSTDRRSFIRHYSNTIDREILKPEEISPEMISNICYNVTEKIYDKINGSSCHQCRQKTRDTKTICRNFECFGVRGQFCGVCAKNRYGVDVAEALMDPYWSCFVCQGICNCSFCRIKKGKRPTGILTPIARREGHDSVKEFLDKLRLKISDEDDYDEFLQDPESVLGFVSHNKVRTVDGIHEIFNASDSQFMGHIISDLKDLIENNTCFTGFTAESFVKTNPTELKRYIELLS